MAYLKDPDKASVTAVPETPDKPPRVNKVYARRKTIKLKPQIIDDYAISHPEIKDPCKEEHQEEKVTVPQGNIESETLKDDDPPCVGGKRKRKMTQKRQWSRPRIMEEGKKPRDPVTIRLRTTRSNKSKKKKDKDREDEFMVDPVTTKTQRRTKNKKPKKRVARVLTFKQETNLSCLELSRIAGPNFPKGRKRMTTLRRSNFGCLMSTSLSRPMPIWKQQSRRSKRNKNMTRWAKLALSFDRLKDTLPLITSHHKDNGLLSQADVFLQTQVTRSTNYEASKMNPTRKKSTKESSVQQMNKQKNNDFSSTACVPLQNEAPKLCKRIADVFEHLIQQLSSHTDYILFSPADVPLHIEVTRSTSYEAVKMDPTSKERTESSIQQMNHQKDNDFSSIACVLSEDPKLRKKRNKDNAKHLIQQMNYQKDHSLLSLADVPLHIEDTLMRSPSDEPLERPIKKAKDISILIKAMRRLKINNRAITTLSKPKKKIVAGKVDLDPETSKEWDLLMANGHPSKSYADTEREVKWKGERETFQSRVDLFIKRMHLLQGNRKFKQWKGSVVDSVVGVFLTQNVSDYLSSNAFMSVAAKFPVDVKEGLKDLKYYVEEPQEFNDSLVDDQIENSDAKDSEFISLSGRSISEVEEHEKTPQRKNEKTGIMEDETVDWKSLRRLYTKEGARDKIHMDTVNWNAVRLSGEQVLADTIMKRGQFRILARRILKFLNDETNQYGTVDLEWLRDLPPNLVKRYLLEIEGIGLKSTECVRLLALKHSAFPVDTNVGRIAVRLGWVPLEPLPDGVQLHQLTQYPSMDAIQKYLWPRLCKLPQETLYELHYQMITFGKVFCTQAFPNCNACPMKSDCKYFASAYVSSKVLLQGPEEKTHEYNTSTPIYSQDIDPYMTSSINVVEECCGSSGYSDQTISCEPMIEFPSSPSSVIPELQDIEDMPTSPCQSYSTIPEIDIDMDALKKNIEDAIVKGSKMQNISEDEISKALVVLTPENACIPINLPRKMKFYDRLRTEHVVYVLPDNHPLLHDFEKREQDDPSPYLLAIWQPGETRNSYGPPKKKCNSDGSELCKIRTCSYCWTIREQKSKTSRGTILIPCRTAMRGGFPLNGTYFQTNEVFADHKTSIKPIDVPKGWCEGLEKSALYCGSSVTPIFRLLDARRIQLCFWTGFVCMRAFDREKRTPRELVRRFHTPVVQRGPKFMKEEDV